MQKTVRAKWNMETEVWLKISRDYDEAKRNMTPRKAVANISGQLGAVYDKGGLDALVEAFSQLAEICFKKSGDAEAFCTEFFAVSGPGGDTFGDETAVLFERLVEKFPKSVKLAGMLADVYGNIVNVSGDEKYTRKLADLMQSNPALENAALQLAYAQSGILSDCSKVRHVPGKSDEKRKSDFQKSQNALSNLKELYEQHPKRAFALEYMRGLNSWLCDENIRDNRQAITETVMLMEQMASQWWERSTFGEYIYAIRRLTNCNNEQECLLAVNKLESHWKNKPDDYKPGLLAMNVSYALENLYKVCQSAVEKSKITARIRELSALWAPASELAHALEAGNNP